MPFSLVNFSEICTGAAPPFTCSCNAAGRTGSHRCRMVFFRGKFRRVESSDSDGEGTWVKSRSQGKLRGVKGFREALCCRSGRATMPRARR